jgi:hypothetical protein
VLSSHQERENTMSIKDTSFKNKVFGIGLERTGTTSLTEALKLLGYKAVHYPEDEVTRAEMHAFFASGSDFIHLSILRDHDAITDTPVCCIYKVLDKSYPGSKFILTIREKQSWLRSRERLNKVQILPQSEKLAHDHPANIYTRFVGDKHYGPYDYDPGKAYDAYNAEASDYFKDRPQQFLMLDICGGEGWTKLAPFLGAAIPEISFPWENHL